MFDFAAGKIIGQNISGEQRIIGTGRIVAAECSINKNPVSGGAILCRAPTGSRFE